MIILPILFLSLTHYIVNEVAVYKEKKIRSLVHFLTQLGEDRQQCTFFWLVVVNGSVVVN
jgi:hypothetical protein